MIKKLEKDGILNLEEDVEDDPQDLNVDNDKNIEINKNDEENLMALSNFHFLEVR